MFKSPAGPRKSAPGSNGDKGKKAAAYDKHRERAAKRQAEQSRSGRDIGELPPVADPKRRAACEHDFKRFCMTYAPHVFTLAWAEPHNLAAARIETVVIDGGLFALAMPRGWGKTTLCMWGTLWAIIYGHRKYAAYIGATGTEATARIAELKTELESNDRLLADFPEVCHPIRALKGVTQAGKAQLHNGKRTQIGWKDRRIVMPTIEGSAASGSVIEARGITGAIRGMRHTTADGRSIRPDLAIVDDPQDDESATSPPQVQKRLRTINGSILRLAGPGEKIAAFVPCTVIAPNDLADQLLDKEKNPRWNGQRTQAVDSLPTADRRWNEYAEDRAAGLRANDGGTAANTFYRKHRAELEQGAKVVWPENIEEGDISALQSIMNLKIDDELTFWAELQQQPKVEDDATEDKLEVTVLETRIRQPVREIVPQATTALTGFIDANSKALWWTVAGWGEGLTGHAVSYGIWPGQPTHYFTNRELKRTLARALPRGGRKAQVLHGLEQLTEELIDREWVNEIGQAVRIKRLLIDASWGDITTTVYQFCRQSKHAGIVMPSHGRYLGPVDRPIDQWTPHPGDRVGHHWRERHSPTHGCRYVTFDSNRWKTQLVEGLRVPAGDPGAITLHHETPERHRLIFDHLTSETPTAIESKGNKLVIYKQLVGRDNDLFDCLVGCAVAASLEGITAAGQTSGAPRKQRRRRRAEVSF